MAALSSIKVRQAELLDRLIKAVGIQMPPRRHNIPFESEMYLADVLKTLVDVFEVRETQENN